MKTQLASLGGTCSHSKIRDRLAVLAATLLYFESLSSILEAAKDLSGGVHFKSDLHN